MKENNAFNPDNFVGLVHNLRCNFVFQYGYYPNTLIISRYVYGTCYRYLNVKENEGDFNSIEFEDMKVILLPISRSGPVVQVGLVKYD